MWTRRAALAALAAACLAACSNAEASAEQEFIDAIREEFPGGDGLSDEEILTVGRDHVCGQYDDGQSGSGVLGFLTNAGYSTEQATFLIGTATSTLCPEHG